MCAIILSAVVLGLLPTPSQAGGVCPASVRVLNPFGANSIPALAFATIDEAFAEESGAQVEVVPIGLRDALAEVAHSDNDALSLLLVEVMAIVAFDRETPILRDLEPLAKITSGISSVLFVPNGGPATVDALLAEARERTLVVSVGNPFAPALSMLQAYVGQPISAVAGLSVREIASQLGKTADAAMLTTPSFLRLRDQTPGAYEPLLTFGGGRNDALDLPTLREISGEDDLATTSSVALFHRPGLSTEAAECLRSALAAAGERKSVQEAAEARDIPLIVQGPDVVRDTIERDQGILNRMQQNDPVAWTVVKHAK